MRSKAQGLVVPLLLILLVLTLLPFRASATSRVFVLDSSGSMLKDGLFGRIKTAIREDYVSQLALGDHIILLTFDEKVDIVVDKTVRDTSGIHEIALSVDRLEARGPWTWLSKALEVTDSQARRLKAQYPGEPLLIYLLTDGINDPPPAVGEPMLRFVEVLSQHFAGFTMEDSYVYVLVFRGEGEAPVVTRAESDTLARRTGGRVMVSTNTPASPRPIPPEVRVGYADTDFGVVDMTGGGTSRDVTIVVKDVVGDASGKAIRVACYEGTFPSYREFQVEPRDIIVDRVGQVATVGVHLPAGLAPGDHSASVQLSCPGVLVSPASFAIRLRVSSGGSRDSTGLRVLLVLAVLAAAYAAYLLARQEGLVVREQDKELQLELVVRGLGRVGLEGMGLGDYSLMLGRLPHELRSLFLVKEGTPPCKVRLGEPTNFEAQEATRVLIIERRRRRQFKTKSDDEHGPPAPAPTPPDLPADEERSSDPDEQFNSDIETRE